MNTLLALPGLHWLAHKQPFSSRLKQAAFDAKHRAHQWGNGESPELGKCVDRYVPEGGSVQILGCGPADLCGVMDMSKPRWMMGMDMSPVAIAEGRRRYYGKFQILGLKVRDMREANGNYDVSVFPESLYYLTPSDQLHLLCCVGGIRIVTIADPAKHSGIVHMILANFKLIEQFHLNRRLVLVF